MGEFGLVGGSGGDVEQLVQLGIQLGHVIWLDAKEPEVAGLALDDAEARIRNQSCLDFTKFRREDEVRLDRQHAHARSDPAERGGEVSAGMAPDVAALPLPRLAQQVVRVHGQEERVHEAGDEVVE